MRGLTWLIKLVLSALITSVVCIASTFWVINTYVDMVLEQYQLKSTVQSTPNWSQLVDRLTKQLSLAVGAPKVDSRSAALGEKGAAPTKPVSGAVKEEADTLQSGSQAGGTSTGTGGSGSSTTPSVKEGSPADKNPPEDAIAVFGHQSKSSGSSAGSSAASDADKRVVVSSEEFTKRKDQLSNEEKNKIFNLMVTRVPQDEMQRISQLMEDGITASELKEIEQILQKYLKPDEYNQLLGMIKAN